MNFLVISLGLTVQTWLGQARVVQIPQSSNRNIDFQISPDSNAVVSVPGMLNVSINAAGDVGNGSTVTVVRGLECGSTVQMYPGNKAQVFSTNFGITNYQNNEACTWKFEANQCTLSAHCPCVDIPRSWECLGDYLKIRTDYVLQNQRFCGGNKPEQPIYSDTDFLSVRFRSDAKNTASGFKCFILCEGPGKPLEKPVINCPKSAVS